MSNMTDEKDKTVINIDSYDTEQEHNVEELLSKEPDIYTRLFYAQRSIEQQYQSVKNEGGYFGKWNDYLYRSLKLESFNDNGDISYPKWTDSKITIRTTEWYFGAGLITSEIMGALLIPNSFSMLGFAPGNIMLVGCFFLTLMSGGVIWWVFLLLDSPEYPVKTFAQIAYLIGGEPCRQLVIFLQLLATILTAAGALISAAESVIILRTDRMCWIGLLLLLAGVMTVIGHIKQLNVLGKYCLLVSFCNYASLFVQLGFMSNSEPNWQNAESLLGIPKAAVETFAVVSGQSMINRIVALSNISYVFAGSIVFPEIITEMKRPWDFWKSMLSSQVVIVVVYLIFGNVVYANQGQFSNSPAVFGISNMSALKGLSFITFITGCFQDVFFAHISSKIIYKNYLPAIFKSLRLDSKKGLILWSITVILTWVVIFVISAGVPEVSAISAFTSALTMIPLTYAIPFLVHLALLYTYANASYIKSFVPFSDEAEPQRVTVSEFLKIGFQKYKLITIFYVLLSLATLSFSGLGVYASTEYIKYIFEVSDATTFSCVSPI